MDFFVVLIDVFLTRGNPNLKGVVATHRQILHVAKAG